MCNSYPVLEGITQLTLSIAYFERTVGQLINNIESAINYSISALTLCSSSLILYSVTQVHLGHVYLKRIKGQDKVNIESAIKHFNNALNIITKDSFPIKWAEIKIELGYIYLYKRAAGNESDNIEISITHYSSALEIYNKPSHPQKWAYAMYGLGTACICNYKGDRERNIYKAINYLNAALEIYTKIDSPHNWALVQKQLGLAYLKLTGLYVISDFVGKAFKNKIMAIAHFKSALQIFYQDKYSFHWGNIQYNLGKLYFDLASFESEKDFNINIEQAISHFADALKFCTKENNFVFWLNIKGYLADAYLEKKSANKEENVKQAIQIYNQILCALYNKQKLSESFTIRIAIFHNKLASIYIEKYSSNKEKNIERAIGLLNANLIAIDQNNFPYIWIETQYKLGKAHEARIVGDNHQNKITAISYYQSALSTADIENDSDCSDYYELTHDLGKLAYELEDWELSVKAYSKCIKEFNEVRELFNDSEFKQKLDSEASIILAYQNIVMAYINLEKFDKAIEYIEQSKAKKLVELLTYRNIYPKGNISKEVIKRLDYLRDKIVQEQQSTSSMSANNISNLKIALENLVSEEIKPVDPSFQLALKVNSIKFEEIIKSVLNSKVILIEWYIAGENTLYAFIVNSDKVNPILISYTAEEYKVIFELFNKYLNTYIEDYSQWKLDLDNLLVEISKSLKLETIIEQVKELFPNCNQLILVPHRWLHLLPIHALPVANQKCLLDLFP